MTIVITLKHQMLPKAKAI